MKVDKLLPKPERNGFLMSADKDKKCDQFSQKSFGEKTFEGKERKKERKKDWRK